MFQLSGQAILMWSSCIFHTSRISDY